MANVGNVFYPTFTNVFFYFLDVFYVFNVFLFSSQRLLHLCAEHASGAITERRIKLSAVSQFDLNR